MSRNYKFYNPDSAYFVCFAVVDWMDVFTRNIYKDILLDSLAYCQKNKGMEVYAWCIMTNHVHLAFRSMTAIPPEKILGDFKRHTSKTIVKAITENPKESRKENLLAIFKKAADEASNVNKYKFWRHDNHPIEIWSNKVIAEKIRYIHNNPVDAGLVFKAEDYMYSSAIDYCGGQSLNLKKFWQAMEKNGGNIEEAAFSTPTGRWARDNGFTKVSWSLDDIKPNSVVIKFN